MVGIELPVRQFGKESLFAVLRAVISCLVGGRPADEVVMDVHGAYCVNFLALTEPFGRGSVSIVMAWALSVLGITLTAAATWLVGDLLVRGQAFVRLGDLSWFEFWIAIIATVLNYSRVFRAILDARPRGRRAVSTNGRSGSAAMAIGSLFVPAVLVLKLVTAGQWWSSRWSSRLRR